MYIEQLEYRFYRNLKHAVYAPAPTVNIICGDNAQGKTNLLECIWLFTGGRSFRGSKESELIRFGEEQALARMQFFSEGRHQTLEYLISGGKRTAFLNGVKKTSLSQIVGHFCAVVFSPNHLMLIKNGPEERRNFLDGALCQLKPSYVVTLGRYRKALEERNSLLKDIRRHRELQEMLPLWDERLSAEGAVIARERAALMQELSGIASSFYSGISGGRETLTLTYRTVGGRTGHPDELKTLEQEMKERLSERREEELFCGYTTVGVHRDDISVCIDQKEARSFGSQGQQRSAVLAMKLAEAEVIARFKEEKPVVLLDDVLSELDPFRKEYLLKRIEGMQVFITCCETITEAPCVIHMENGAFTQAEE